MVMYVNMDIFKEAGLTEEDIPTTWEEVMKVCETIKANTSHYGMYIQLPDNWGDQGLIFSAGGEMLNADKTRVDFTNEGCIKAVKMWQELYTNGYAPVCTDSEAMANFTAGDIAMQCTTVMKINTFSEYVTYDLKVAQCPGFEGVNKQLPAGRRGDDLLLHRRCEEGCRVRVHEVHGFQGRHGNLHQDRLSVRDHRGGSDGGWSGSRLCPDAVCASVGVLAGGSVGLEIDARWLTVRNAILMEGADVVESLTALEEECNMMLENA